MGGHHLRYPLPYPLPGFFATTLPEVKVTAWLYDMTHQLGREEPRTQVLELGPRDGSLL